MSFAAFGSRLLVSIAVTALMACASPADSGSTDTTSDACAPDCSGKACGPDGCGGSCGTCADGTGCNAAGQCTQPEDASPTDTCTQTCEEAGFECGEACGLPCGVCQGTQVSCVEGHCVCAPVCSLDLCAEPDGCDGTCPPCPSDENCADCVLRLSVSEVDEGTGDQIRGATLTLHYMPPDEAPHPRTADLHFVVEGPVRLLELTPGPSLEDAGKALHRDADTGKPWRELGDGIIQVLVLSTDNTDRMGPGLWLTMRFVFGPEAYDDPLPLVVRVVERAETFAPPDADLVLMSGGYDAPVAVWP